jgi:hypothetical protein
MSKKKALQASTLQDLSNGVLGAQFGTCLPFNQGSEHSQLHTNVTLKVGVHLKVIRFHPLHSPPFFKVCFTPKHTFNLMGPCTSHLVINPMLRLNVVLCGYVLHIFHVNI